jgi:hypothetical protein
MKELEKKEIMEESGTRDMDGSWVPETPQAKLRNRLSPFWTLTEILSNDEMYQKIISSDKGKDIIKSLIERCEENKSVILDLIKETESHNS